MTTRRMLIGALTVTLSVLLVFATQAEASEVVWIKAGDTI